MVTKPGLAENVENAISSRPLSGAARPALRVQALLIYLALGLIALLPRVWDLGGFITIDEANFWLRRSEIFLNALRSGDYAATALSAHPGVTTMWLGSAGILLRRVLLEWGLLSDLAFPTRLALLRLPAVLTHVAMILIGYGLLRRLFPTSVAALAALLWALDPFVIGYSRLLHTDALAASFATVSLLAALVCFRVISSSTPAQSSGARRPAWLLIALSGVFAGLATLSKLPALALAPAVGLAALLYTARIQAGADASQRGVWEHLFAVRNAQFVVPLLVWCAMLALTILALWPALWVSPLAAYRALREAVEVEGGQPHMMGNFFMGREVAAPGPLFYPVALALRLTPWVLLGLLALPIVWRRVPDNARRDLALLAAFALIFVLAMTIFPKKFNRYIVPAVPALDILAAAGLLFALANLWLRAALAMLVTVLGLGTLLRFHPYPIAYFSPLFGGPATGARTFVVGWGEGYEQAAVWLNQQPDISGVLTISNMTPTLQPYLRQGAQALAPRTPALPEQAGYVVVYIEQVQRGNVLPPYDQFYGRATPLHTVEVGGIEYAWIYQAPPPVAVVRQADFGAQIGLRGFELGELHTGRPLALRLFWEARGAAPADYLLFVHLIGADGQRYAQADLPPGGTAAPTSGWQAGRFFTTDLQLPLAQELPAGQYQLLIGLYDPASGQRVALGTGQAADPAIDGPEALLLTTIP